MEKCASHDYFEGELRKIKLDVELLKQNKVNSNEWLTGVKDLQNDIALLRSRLEELIEDRHEDKKLIEEYRKELKNIADVINSTNLNNAVIEKGQIDILRRQDGVEKKLDEILKMVTFNWLDFIKSFLEKNMIAKILTWTVAGILVSIPVMMFVYYLTGENISGLLIKIFTK